MNATDDFIVDMDINLPSCTVTAVDKKYLPNMLVYN